MANNYDPNQNNNNYQPYRPDNNFNEYNQNQNNPYGGYDPNGNPYSGNQGGYNPNGNNYNNQGGYDFNNNNYNNNYNNQNNPYNNPYNNQYNANNGYNNGFYNNNFNNNNGGSSAMSIASMVLGILSDVCCCLGPLTMLAGIIGLVLGIIALRRNTVNRGFAIAGVIMCSIGILFGLWSTIAFFRGESDVDYRNYDFSEYFDY